MSGMEQRIDAFFGECSTNKSTVKAYRSAYRKFLSHVPMDAWNDPETVLRYKQLLKKSLQGPFGVMFARLSEKCAELSVPCLSPETLRWQPKTPMIVARYIERLAVGSSYPEVSYARWGDLNIRQEQLFLGNRPLTSVMESALEQLQSYFWGTTPPEKTAPVVALSRKTRNHQLQPAMIEAIVDDQFRSGVHGVESQLCYDLYEKMVVYGMSVGEIETAFSRIQSIADLPDDKRRKAHKTLLELRRAFEEGDLLEVDRLLGFAVHGEYEKKRQSLQEAAVSLARKSLLPTAPPGMALSENLG